MRTRSMPDRLPFRGDEVMQVKWHEQNLVARREEVGRWEDWVLLKLVVL
jgi:hypothetical protein